MLNGFILELLFLLNAVRRSEWLNRFTRYLKGRTFDRIKFIALRWSAPNRFGIAVRSSEIYNRMLNKNYRKSLKMRHKRIRHGRGHKLFSFKCVLAVIEACRVDWHFSSGSNHHHWIIQSLIEAFRRISLHTRWLKHLQDAHESLTALNDSSHRNAESDKEDKLCWPF